MDGATVVLTYNKPLDGASTPSSTAFVLRVAGDPVSIEEVSVNGSEVTLTLAAPVPAGQTVSLDYTQPMSNPIQDGSGKKAQSFTRWYLVTESTITITNPVITVPGAPTALSATAVGNTQINLSWTAPGENGGAPISGYKIESSPDGVANWTELVANTGNPHHLRAHRPGRRHDPPLPGLRHQLCRRRRSLQHRRRHCQHPDRDAQDSERSGGHWHGLVGGHAQPACR